MAQHEDDLQQRPELKLQDRGGTMFKQIRVQSGSVDGTVEALDELQAFKRVMDAAPPRTLGGFTCFSVGGGPRSVRNTQELIDSCNFPEVHRRYIQEALNQGLT